MDILKYGGDFTIVRSKSLRNRIVAELKRTGQRHGF